jgi:hypothetical protein
VNAVGPAFQLARLAERRAACITFAERGAACITVARARTEPWLAAAVQVPARTHCTHALFECGSLCM